MCALDVVVYEAFFYVLIFKILASAHVVNFCDKYEDIQITLSDRTIPARFGENPYG